MDLFIHLSTVVIYLKERTRTACGRTAERSTRSSAPGPRASWRPAIPPGPAKRAPPQCHLSATSVRTPADALARRPFASGS
eukprot:724851-Prorocentrum_minimum.AAC.1